MSLANPGEPLPLCSSFPLIGVVAPLTAFVRNNDVDEICASFFFPPFPAAKKLLPLALPGKRRRRSMLPARNSAQYGQSAEERRGLRWRRAPRPSSRKNLAERRRETVRATKTNPGTTFPHSAIWSATVAIHGSLDPRRSVGVRDARSDLM